MKNKYRTATAYLVLSAIFLQVAHLTFTGTQPITFRNEQGQITGMADLTKLFAVVSWCALLVGLLLLVSAGRTLLIKNVPRAESNSRLPGLGRLFHSGPLWSVFNTMLIPLGFWMGYAEITPSRLQGTNPDIVLCISILVLMPLFAIVTTSFAREERLKTPAWNRFPFKWQHDPLQALFMTSLSMFAALIGSLFHLGISGNHGMWTVATFASLFLGLLVGQTIVYWLYRDRIARSKPMKEADAAR